MTTRNITIAVILILLIWGCYEVLSGDIDKIRESVDGIPQLSEKSEKLTDNVKKLEKITTQDFETKKTELAKVIEEYKTTKSEYDTVVANFSNSMADDLLNAQETKDIYDVDFLWTIVGNYATEEGINLKFDIVKNTSAASSINNNGEDYIVCDLRFTITGNYINLTDFIYDLEDDDRLNFEINDFEMKKGETKTDTKDEKKNGNTLVVTLIVREVKVNTTNLIETSVSNSYITRDIIDEASQVIDSATTKAKTSDEKNTSKVQNVTN